MSGPTIFRDDLVVGKSRNGSIKFAVVEQVAGIDDSDESSDSELEEFSSTPLEKGFLRVTWYPDGKVEVVKESKIQLVDRNCLPGDVVRTKDGNQLGTVLSTNADCDVAIVGTSKTLKGINVAELTPTAAFHGDEMVSYGPWLGRIEEVMEKLLLKFSNGSRAKLDLETNEYEDLLFDVYPHPSDESRFNTIRYYPGQFLRGPAKVFKDIKWISGEKIKFKPKTQYRALVEQVEVYAVKIKWGTRAFSDVEEKLISGDAEKQVSIKTEEDEEDKKFGSSVDPEPSTPLSKKNENDENEKNPAEPPPALISNEELKKVNWLYKFWRSHLEVGERLRYKLNEEQADSLNQQIDKNAKKTKHTRLKKRMDQNLQHSTSKSSSLSPNLKRKGRRRNIQSNTSIQDSLELESESESEDDGDDSVYEEEEEDDLQIDDGDDTITPSSGSCASIAVEIGNDIKVVVYNESDMTISSPIGQIPTILGMMSCRVAGFELDFSLIQESGILQKINFVCNIQNPECTKETIETVSKNFQKFMKAMLKKNKVFLKDSNSCIEMMSQCPLAIRAFIKQQQQQSSKTDQEIYFEITTGDKHTSGMINKDGKKFVVEFIGDEVDFNSMPRDIQNVPDLTNTVATKPHDFALTAGPAATKQTGSNVKFHAGEYVTVEVTKTFTKVDVQWQDGTMEYDIQAIKLTSAHHVDDNDFGPGDFVTDKRVSDPEKTDLYGVVLKADSQHRMTKIQWIKDGKPTAIEEVSAYEVADHPELQFRISDIVVRVSNLHCYDPAKKCELTEEETVGELLRISEFEHGMLEVFWANGIVAHVHPKDVLVISDDDLDEIFASESDIDEFENSDASWMTASTEDEDVSNDEIDDQHESDPIGDGDTPLSTNNRFEVFDFGSEDGGDAGPLHTLHDDIENHDDVHDITPESAHDLVPVDADQKVPDSNTLGELTESMVCENQIHDDINQVVLETQNQEISNEYSEDDVKTNEGNHGEVHEFDENHNAAANSVSNSENGKKNCGKTSEHNINYTEPDKIHQDGGNSVTATISSESVDSDFTTISDLFTETNSSFSVEASVPMSHHFVKRYFDSSASKTFIKAVQRDLKLLRTSLPRGITVKSYENRMDLLSVLIEGPEKTPYEDGIFTFDIYLSSNYPDSPPSVHYISFSPRLNPNLYETGRVCVSLLGTWSGKGNERWTKDSTVLQVLLSIQGLILNSEPYYNEAGYESHKGTTEGMKNSRCYNEMVVLRMVQHMTSVLSNPPEAFEEEVKSYCCKHVSKLLSRVKNLLLSETDSSQNEFDDDSSEVDNVEILTEKRGKNIGFPLLPLSKGVMLSLRSRLRDLENAAKVMGHL